ncbi:hypothetical protein [Antribacter gilvus]|uniref:hypothetical protein n=1 Tax=Antribacter gilvus TaxID=2304675 RepID=UPI000F7BAF71|nr:hypothetical protein [Antribacter gilvus]
MRRAVLVTLGVVALAVFAWIGWPRDAAPAAVEPTGQASVGGPLVQPQVGEPTDDDVDPDGDAGIGAGDPAPTVTSEPDFDATAPAAAAPAGWDDAVRAAARESARSAVAAFADAEQPPEEWWAGLSPLLTPQARPVYQDVDPRLVPVRAVTGEPTVVDESSTLLTEVTVPTDVGEYTVLLARADGASPWLAEQIRPPESGAAGAASAGAEGP